MKDEKFKVSDPAIILCSDGTEQIGYITEVSTYECRVNRDSNGWNTTFHKKQLAKATQLDIHRIERQITSKENKRLKDIISNIQRDSESKDAEISKLKEIILRSAMKGIE